MGIFGIRFNKNNSYGIEKKTEWKGAEGLKQDLKSDPLFTKKDIKEIKQHINNGDLGAYMDTLSADMRNALGLKLSGRVDDLNEAQRIAKGVPLEGADLDKVLSYIQNAKEAPANAEAALATPLEYMNGQNTVNAFLRNPNASFGTEEDYANVAAILDKFNEYIA